MFSDEVSKEDVVSYSGVRFEEFRWLNWHHESNSGLGSYRWRGIKLMKSPIDVALYIEAIQQKRPQTIIEIGSRYGGSTEFFAETAASSCENAVVISVDIDRSEYVAKHPNILVFTGDSLDRNIFNKVGAHVIGPTMLVHDGNHNYRHVYADLLWYHKFVTPSQYMVVEDCVCDMFPGGVAPGMAGKGPLYAAERFLNEHPEFFRDHDKDRYGCLGYTFGGWLCRE